MDESTQRDDDDAGAPPDSFADVDSQIGAFVGGLGLPRGPAARDGSAVDDAITPGTRIAGHFEVIRELGRGGMGVVVLAHDTALRREVAVKLVAAAATRPVALLEREAQAMARLAHPNVLTVHEVGAWDRGIYIAMEYVDGGTLRRWLLAEPRPWRRIVEVFVQAARGLHAAHAAGFVHRDFKPENVLVGSDGRVRVADFGLARAWDPDDHGDVTAPGVAARARRGATVEGLVGTPAYMAPEQFTGGAIGPLADQYALGVALFEALCGQRPYPDGAWTARPDALRRPPSRLPSWLRRVLVRTVAVDAAARYPDLAAVAQALDDGLGRAARARRVAVFTLGVGVTAGLAIGLGDGARTAPCEGTGARAAEVWSPERRASIGDAYARATTHGAQTWANAAAWIDDYVAQWASLRRDACVATRVETSSSESLLDRTNACLDARLDALAGLLAVMDVADAATVRNTDAMLAQVPPLSPCSDAEYLRAAVPPPDDPDVRARVAEHRTQAAQISFAQFGVPIESTRADLERLLAEAVALGYPPVAAQTEAALGKAEVEAGNYERAATLLRHAYFEARTVADHGLAADAAIVLAYLAGVVGDDHDVALLWLDHARADLASKAAPPWLEAGLETTHAQVLMHRDRIAEAIVHLRRGIELGRAIGLHAQWVALMQSDLAAALDASGESTAALATFDEGIELARRELGDHNTTVATLLNNRGQALTRVGRQADAIADLERAFAIEVALWGEGHVGLMAPLLNLGIAYGAAGDAAAADERLSRALALATDAGDRALVLAAQGWLAARGGDHRRALQLRTDALSLQEQSLAPDDVELAVTHTHLAESQIALGDLPAAAMHLDEALRRWDARDDHTDPREAHTWKVLAGNDLASGRTAEARAAAQRVLALAEALDVEPQLVADAREILVQAAARP